MRAALCSLDLGLVICYAHRLRRTPLRGGRSGAIIIIIRSLRPKSIIITLSLLLMVTAECSSPSGI